MRASLPLLERFTFPSIRRSRLETLQVNVGYLCNQSCTHCHVSAGPTRKEQMSAETIECVISFLDATELTTLDITGGAPELNPGFKTLVEAGRARGLRVIDRCNLTVLTEPGQQGLAAFLAEQRVEVFASLPCYLEKNVDQQRGRGVFARSIEGLRLLNAYGYGTPDSGLVLNLIYNPQGPHLPPPQAALESAYKRALRERFGVEFDRLLTLANLPVGRFGSMLQSKGEFDAYLDLLREAHSPSNLPAVMCRSLISIDWKGYVYDCDFNQMLDLPIRVGGSQRTHLRDLVGQRLEELPIAVRAHCYGCTAGQGSSCGGALA